MPRALLSVYNKTDLLSLASGLNALGWDLVTSGGTQKALENAGLPTVPIERLTNTPEMLGGRVKTLHPAVHAGILARDTDDDLNELREAGFAPIDLVVCNLYPFQETISKAGVTLEDAIENIDIGGVTLLRAAAKNFARVTVIVDPADYAAVLTEIEQEGRTLPTTRQRLAVKAFAHTTEYDTIIHAYLSGEVGKPKELEDQFALSLIRVVDELRYGENPHQKAGFYAENRGFSPLHSHQLGGKALSYNNILDADAAWRTVCSFDSAKEAAVVIVKHLTPCGVAVGSSLESAYPFALESDPVSAFGGVIAVNRPVTAEFVKALDTLFIEVIIAPEFDDEACQMLREGRKNCRLLKINTAAQPLQLEVRSVLGGYLIQERDNGDPANAEWRVVTKRAPSESETETLKFAWTVVQHVKSNSIVLARQGATVGVGGGLSSRVDAVKIAVEKAGKNSKGAALASDAFFPFPDGIEASAAAGVTAVIQPGGALRDKEVIDAADQANIAMIFTGVRHFRH